MQQHGSENRNEQLRHRAVSVAAARLSCSEKNNDDITIYLLLSSYYSSCQQNKCTSCFVSVFLFFYCDFRKYVWCWRRVYVWWWRRIRPGKLMPVQIYISNLHCERYVAMRIVIVRLECSFVGATAFLMYSVAQNKPHYLTFQLSSRKFVLNDRVTTWLGGHAARLAI